MKIFAISDLHISRTSDKPMEVFGGNWVGYLDKIKADWTKKAAEGDVVLIPGDISWAMDLKEALFDMEEFSALPGEKILVRGNHDYWWKSISRFRTMPSDWEMSFSAARGGGAFPARPAFRRRTKNCTDERRSASASLFLPQSG